MTANIGTYFVPPITGTVFLNVPINLPDGVALGNGAQGGLVVNSPTNTLTAGTLDVGVDGPDISTLTIQSGGVVSDTYAFIGVLSGSVGTATVSGTDSRWDVSGTTYIGDYGQGTLAISSGGQVNSAATHLAFQPGSVGNVTVSGSGSRWNSTGVFDIGLGPGGPGGQGSLTVNSGASGTSAALLIAGSVNVTDSGSQWTTTSGDLVVGEVDGPGTLSVANAAVVNNAGNSFVGLAGGTATVTDAGSQWNSAYLAVGYSLGFPQGQGTLNIQNGAEVTASGGVDIATFAGSGTITVDGPGSRLHSAGIAVGNGFGGAGQGGLVVQNGGSVTSTNGATIGLIAGALGSVTVAGLGSQWDSGLVTVGAGGQGLLTVNGGGQVTVNGALYIGSNSGSSGIVEVSGLGSLLSANQTSVGGAGAGTVDVNDGGVLNIETINIGTPGTVNASGGTLQGNVTNHGTLHLVDTAAIVGDFALAADGKLALDVLGSEVGEFGRLDVFGFGTFAGAIEITFTNGFAPRMGDSWELVDNLGGTNFDGVSIEIHGLQPGFEYEADFTNDMFVLTALNDGVPGNQGMSRSKDGVFRR